MQFFDPPSRPFLPGQYRIALARTVWETEGHFRLRRAVFCEEQRVFSFCDRDAIDADAIPLVATTCVLGAPDQVVGAVRIHEALPGIWWGSRLAVDPAHRAIGRLGAELIRLAVSTAAARGCTEFLAHVQAQNTLLFRRLHWETLEVVSLHGLPHHRMRATLAHYPPHGQVEQRFVRPVGATRSPAARQAA